MLSASSPLASARVAIGIAYKEDVRAARRVVLSALAGDSKVMTDPAPEVVVTSLGPSSVNLELRFWVEHPLLQWAKQFEYLEKCKDAVDKAGIQIPYPHLQLFLEKTDGLSQLTDAVKRA